jgi:hypothetical protein
VCRLSTFLLTDSCCWLMHLLYGSAQHSSIKHRQCSTDDEIQTEYMPHILSSTWMLPASHLAETPALGKTKNPAAWQGSITLTRTCPAVSWLSHYPQVWAMPLGARTPTAAPRAATPFTSGASSVALSSMTDDHWRAHMTTAWEVHPQLAVALVSRFPGVMHGIT